MNSNIEALACKDVLWTIFENLPLADLARAACVCRLWFSLASDREMQIRAFRSPWKLKEVIGNPSSSGFWRDNGLGRFAISHRLARGDSVASLAVKYSVQVLSLSLESNFFHGQITLPIFGEVCCILWFGNQNRFLFMNWLLENYQKIQLNRVLVNTQGIKVTF